MEGLYALALLWSMNLCSEEQYNVALNEVFLNDVTSSELLLKLESCSNNCKNTFAILYHYFTYEATLTDLDQFGKVLFANLRRVYESNRFSIEAFGEKCYAIWNILPGYINDKQPFWALSYADDPLSWGDEAQSRSLYESAFGFYNEAG